MQGQFDIIVIGSGLGGLECGAMLAREGMGVCVAEQAALPGGCLQSFSRRGHAIDTGMHYIGSMQAGGIMRRYFEYFGILGSLRLRPLDEAFDVVSLPGAGDYAYMHGYEAFEKHIGELFPHEKAGLGRYCAKLREIGGSIGIGFAIPSNMAKTLADQLIQFGEIKRGLLGIKGMEMSADIAKAMNLNVQRGAFVSEVLPNSGSAKAGIKSGDVIVSLNGKPLNSFAELRSRIATTEPGTKVKLGLLRDGKPVDVEVTLDKSTSSTASAELIIPALQGASFSDGQMKDGTKGVVIDNVDKGSAAAQVGLHKDDIIIGLNRERIHSIAELRKVLEGKPPVIALNVIRGNESIYLLLR